jgi:hypothetical protein
MGTASGGQFTTPRCLALLLAALAIPLCHADEDRAAVPPLSLKGFGTLGIARSDKDSIEFVRDLSQPKGLTHRWTSTIDSVVGLQAGMTINAQTEAVVQAISRYRFDGTYRPEISWAFLRHELSPNWQIRVGRLGTEFFMLADSRLVGYANLTVRPPPDYYGPLIFSYFDGTDVSSTYPVGGGLLRGKLFAGYAAETPPLLGSIKWNLTESPLLGGHLDYVIGPWQLRLGHTQIRFKREMPFSELAGFDILSLAPELATQGTWVRFDSLGLVYDDGPVQIQAMLNRIDYDTTSYESSRAGYVIASYRWRQLTPYLGYSRVKSSAKPLSASLPPGIQPYLEGFVAQTHSDQHTVTLGARWDLRSNVALKAQVDAIRAQPDSVFPFVGSNAKWIGRMKVFSLSMDFLF